MRQLTLNHAVYLDGVVSKIQHPFLSNHKCILHFASLSQFTQVFRDSVFHPKRIRTQRGMHKELFILCKVWSKRGCFKSRKKHETHINFTITKTYYYPWSCIGIYLNEWIYKVEGVRVYVCRPENLQHLSISRCLRLLPEYIHNKDARIMENLI